MYNRYLDGTSAHIPDPSPPPPPSENGPSPPLREVTEGLGRLLRHLSPGELDSGDILLVLILLFLFLEGDNVELVITLGLLLLLGSD